jgi:peptide/nickel transport system substrate-binding protein
MHHSPALASAPVALLAFALAGAAHAAKFECPVTGGDLVFGQEAKVNSLDMHASSTISTRNIAMHMFEALLTRDEDNNPILELAKAVDVSDDGLVYAFTLRDGIKFHNGKPMIWPTSRRHSSAIRRSASRA